MQSLHVWGSWRSAWSCCFFMLLRELWSSYLLLMWIHSFIFRILYILVWNPRSLHCSWTHTQFIVKPSTTRQKYELKFEPGASSQASMCLSFTPRKKKLTLCWAILVNIHCCVTLNPVSFTGTFCLWHYWDATCLGRPYCILSQSYTVWCLCTDYCDVI